MRGRCCQTTRGRLEARSGAAAQRAHLERRLGLLLLQQHRLEHVVHLAGRRAAAVARADARDQHELLHALGRRRIDQVDVALVVSSAQKQHVKLILACIPACTTGPTPDNTGMPCITPSVPCGIPGCNRMLCNSGMQDRGKVWHMALLCGVLSPASLRWGRLGCRRWWKPQHRPPQSGRRPFAHPPRSAHRRAPLSPSCPLSAPCGGPHKEQNMPYRLQLSSEECMHACMQSWCKGH